MISSINLSLLLLASTRTTQALTIHPRDTSQTLPLSVIVGISVAVIAIFALATTLFVIYFAHQAPSPFLQQQRRYYRQEFVVSPKDLVEPWSYVVNANNHHHHRHSLHDAVNGTGDDGKAETNGQYYNRTAKQPSRFSIIQLTHDPRSAIHGPDNAMPAHHAYDPNTVSKAQNYQASGTSGPLSPPQPAHRLRPSTPDSFIIQSYRSVVEDAARQSSSNRQSLPSPALPSPSEPSTSSPTRTRASSLWSSRLSALSLPKIQISKKNKPPRLNLAMQPLGRAKKSPDGDMHITPPLLNDPRFIDRPLGAGVVVIERNRPPSPDDGEKYAAYTEVPLGSGKSFLYGM
ncbi:hypothetical protein TgHK011_008851 [Trichoderma gracile]|nr:hypothetical protein TgHK011_008851 [Trichoderma gracile]